MALIFLLNAKQSNSRHRRQGILELLRSLNEKRAQPQGAEAGNENETEAVAEAEVEAVDRQSNEHASRFKYSHELIRLFFPTHLLAILMDTFFKSELPTLTSRTPQQ